MNQFNNLYIEFLNFLSKKYSQYKKYIIISNNHNQYIIDFVELNLPYIEDISIKNSDIYMSMHN
jgi:hypothetical protein